MQILTNKLIILKYAYHVHLNDRKPFLKFLHDMNLL